MSSTDLKQQIAITSLNSMMSKGYFDICTIDTVCKLMGTNPKGDAYTMLHALHCVHFEKMPPEVREAIPELIKECLGFGPVFQFKTMEPEVIEITSPRKNRVLRLLGV